MLWRRTGTGLRDKGATQQQNHRFSGTEIVWFGVHGLSLILQESRDFCLLRLAAVAASSDQDPEDVELDEVVVRTTRIDKRIHEIPAAISVVTKDDIQRGRQQLALDESLAAIPGVFIQSPYNFSRDQRIAIRGFGARSPFGIRGVKIIVGGQPPSRR